MASSPKKPHLQLETPENTEESSSSFASEESGENDGPQRNRETRNGIPSGVRNGNGDGVESDSDSDDDDEEEDDDIGAHQLSPAEREIQVDFEARTPQECDFHGIVNLLRQMMRSNAGSNTSSVNVSDLANHIIAQRNVGSVITQSHDDMDDEDDSDEEQENNAGGANNANGNAARPNDMLEPNNEVFGVGTVIRLTRGQEQNSIAEQIISHLLVNTARSEKAAALRAFFSTPGNDVGFLISERIINMPPQISVPLYETLANEVRKARAKNLPFNFTHYVMISRLLVSPNDERNIMYTNAEEEVFLPECDLVLDLACSSSSGGATNNGSNQASSSVESMGRTFNSLSQDEFIEKRKVLVFKANKLDKITSLVKGAFPIN